MSIQRPVVMPQRLRISLAAPCGIRTARNDSLSKRLVLVREQPKVSYYERCQVVQGDFRGG